MRLSAACLAALLLVTPALADDSVADQAAKAYGLFAGSLSQDAFILAKYPGTALKGVAGNWIRLNGPDPKSGIETYGTDAEKLCPTPAALTLASPDAYSMTLTTNLKGANLTQQYILVAGATFAERTDPLSYFNAIGLGADKTGDNFDQQRALLLSVANEIVQIYRPSADILVITHDNAYPIVLARCPADASAPGVVVSEPSSSAPPPASDASSSAPALVPDASSTPDAGASSSSAR